MCRKSLKFVLSIVLFALVTFSFVIHQPAIMGKYTYKDFEKPAYCKSCHSLIGAQWDQSMMSEAYTHKWDEIEYFELAVAHSKNDTSMKGVHEGCNGCHTPMAFLKGELPPPRPSENSRANESVSCEVCHSIRGYTGDLPFNHNYIIEPGQTKFTSRKGKTSSPDHEIVATELHSSAEFCGICHNEKSPFDVWVKSTYNELKEGPYYAEGYVCQDCHMVSAEAKTAKMGARYKDAKMHLFNGAHDPGKINGTVEIRIYSDIQDVIPGEPVILTVTLFNQKTGHKFPTGSVEDRIVWLHLEAIDADGNIYHIPVDKKGFEGEEYTIASEALAYQDLGIPLEKENFEGIRREDVPLGDRIFRMPYFDPQGRMTMQQWNTDSLGVDYRFGPRETKVETYTFNAPYEIAPGELKINAVMNYRLLVKPVAELLNVPKEEYAITEVNRQEISLNVIP